MHKTFWLTCAAAFAVTAGVATQTPDTQTRSQTRATGRTITVTGCVQRASDTATAGTTSSSGAATKFELTNASIGSGASGSGMASGTGTASGTTTGSTTGSASGTGTGSATGTTSEATGTSGAGAAKTYKLDAADSQLAAHVNHKVQVTGTLDESTTAGTSGTTSETAGTTGAAKSAAPRLKVESVKMVSATCP